MQKKVVSGISQRLEAQKGGALECLSQLSVQLLILAQVMIALFMGLSPALGSLLTMRGLLRILSPSVTAPCPHLSLPKWKKKKKTKEAQGFQCSISDSKIEELCVKKCRQFLKTRRSP